MPLGWRLLLAQHHKTRAYTRRASDTSRASPLQRADIWEVGAPCAFPFRNLHAWRSAIFCAAKALCSLEVSSSAAFFSASMKALPAPLYTILLLLNSSLESRDLPPLLPPSSSTEKPGRWRRPGGPICDQALEAEDGGNSVSYTPAPSLILLLFV